MDVISFQRDILALFVHVHEKKKLGETECKCRSKQHFVVTCAVGPSAVNVIIGLPLLSNLVDVDEYNQHSN